MFQTEGQYNAEALDSMRKLMLFLSIETCKAILVVSQNTITNLKVSIICVLVKSIYKFRYGR